MIAIVSVAAAAVAAAFVAISRQAGDAAFEPGGAFAPAIAERQADVDRIVVERGAARIELAREGAGWTLASRAGYPARFEEVKALVSGLAGLRTERIAAAARVTSSSLTSRCVTSRSRVGSSASVSTPTASSRACSCGADMIVGSTCRKTMLVAIPPGPDGSETPGDAMQSEASCLAWA